MFAVVMHTITSLMSLVGCMSPNAAAAWHWQCRCKCKAQPESIPAQCILAWQAICKCFPTNTTQCPKMPHSRQGLPL